MHYAGHVQWTNLKGEKTNILPGWSACCSGKRAEMIRARVQHTYERSEVTCLACLRTLTIADHAALVIAATEKASATAEAWSRE
jgi:hypothetical protein